MIPLIPVDCYKQMWNLRGAPTPTTTKTTVSIKVLDVLQTNKFAQRHHWGNVSSTWRTDLSLWRSRSAANRSYVSHVRVQRYPDVIHHSTLVDVDDPLGLELHAVPLHDSGWRTCNHCPFVWFCPVNVGLGERIFPGNNLSHSLRFDRVSWGDENKRVAKLCLGGMTFGGWNQSLWV